MTQADYARHRRVSRQMISKVRDKLVFVTTADGKRVDVVASDLALAGSLERLTLQVAEREEAAAEAAATAAAPEQTPAPPAAIAASPAPTRPTGAGRLADAKANDVEYQARIRELTYKKEVGEAVDREEFESRAFDVFRALRDRVQSLPSVITPKMLSAADEATARKILADDLHQLFDQFAIRLADSLGGKAIEDETLTTLESVDSDAEDPTDTDATLTTTDPA